MHLCKKRPAVCPWQIQQIMRPARGPRRRKLLCILMEYSARWTAQDRTGQDRSSRNYNFPCEMRRNINKSIAKKANKQNRKQQQISNLKYANKMRQKRCNKTFVQQQHLKTAAATVARRIVSNVASCHAHSPLSFLRGYKSVACVGRRLY